MFKKAFSGNKRPNNQYESIKNTLQGARWNDDNLPLPSDTWTENTRNRTGSQYCKLLMPKTLEHIDSLDEIDPNDYQKPQSIILDASIGNGNAVNHFKRDDNFFIGVAMNEGLNTNTAKMDCVVYTQLPYGPNALKLQTHLQGNCDFIMDVFGGSTYGDNPIHVVIYLASLLAMHGKALLIISGIKGQAKDESPIGYVDARNKLNRFLRDEFNIQSTISRTHLRSVVSANDISVDFVVTLECVGEPKFNRTIQEYFAKADADFGVVTSIPKQLAQWGVFNRGQQIIGKQYSSTNPLQAVSYQVQKQEFVQDENRVNTGIMTLLVFQNNLDLNTFSLRFMEYYINQKDTPWRIETQSDDLNIKLFFKTDKADDAAFVDEKIGLMR